VLDEQRYQFHFPLQNIQRIISLTLIRFIRFKHFGKASEANPDAALALQTLLELTSPRYIAKCMIWVLALSRRVLTRQYEGKIRTLVELLDKRSLKAAI
jgi:hypothetical protein